MRPGRRRSYEPERLKTIAYLPQPEIERLSRILLSPRAAQLKQRLENAVAALPHEKRELFTLHHQEGKTAAEIAVVYGLDEMDVFQEITRIDAEIAARMHEAVEEDGGADAATDQPRSFY
jgi:DNA-directed RNA polymerase specialized sigma24 family protein